MVYKKRVKNPRLKKRWYASASGFGISASIGTGTPKTKRELTKFVKRSILAPKLYYNDLTTAIVQQNGIYTYNLSAQLAQGNTSANREGDKVFIKTINLKHNVDCDFSAFPAGTTNAFLRMIVLTHDDFTNPSATTYGSGLGSTSIFQSNNNPIYRNTIDFKQCNVICDNLYQVTNQSGTNVGILSKVFTQRCVMNKNFQYQLSSAEGKFRNLYVVAIPFAFGTVTGTTNIMGLTTQVNFSFTD